MTNTQSSALAVPDRHRHRGRHSRVSHEVSPVIIEWPDTREGVLEALYCVKPMNQ
jgi:hypothetical protein